MIVLGPILGIFCLGIFCLIMDIIYPEKDVETFIVRPQSIGQHRTPTLSHYNDYNSEESRYAWNDDD